MKEKIHNFLVTAFIFLTLVVVLGGSYLYIDIEEEKYLEENMNKCFDKHNNVIKGVICEGENNPYNQLKHALVLVIIIIFSFPLFAFITKYFLLGDR